MLSLQQRKPPVILFQLLWVVESAYEWPGIWNFREISGSRNTSVEPLCREGDIPSSKICLALEKPGKLGLVESSKEQFAVLPSREAGRTTFVDLAPGPDNHVKRHLIHRAGARHRIWSYMEWGDIEATDGAKNSGSPLLRRIARNAVEQSVDHRVVFGFGYRAAPELVAFLKKHRANLDHVTGVRYSAEFGRPFHVIDEEPVILSVDHSFVPQGRVASLTVRDAALAQRLAQGLEALWSKAMRNLREITFQPAP